MFPLVKTRVRDSLSLLTVLSLWIFHGRRRDEMSHLLVVNISILGSILTFAWRILFSLRRILFSLRRFVVSVCGILLCFSFQIKLKLFITLNHLSSVLI